MRRAQVPWHTMQVDWRARRWRSSTSSPATKTTVSGFVASLPYSGVVFDRGYLDEKVPNWLDAHLQAFEYCDGVAQVIVPDNASTASNLIARGDRTREVNSEYRDILDHYHTAAVPTRPVRPTDKACRGRGEGGDILGDWTAGRSALRQPGRLQRVDRPAEREAIDDRIPFRSQEASRRELFIEHKQSELITLREALASVLRAPSPPDRTTHRRGDQ
jgi:hypothetical protein